MFRGRQYVVFIFLIAFFAALLSRLFYLQVVCFERFSEMAAGQHNSVFKIDPRRGTIFDRYMEPLALNLDVPSVYCDPRVIKDKEKTGEYLSRILGIDTALIEERITRDKAFVWIKRKVSPSEAEKVRELDLDGVYFMSESQRNYPNDDMASHVIGFVGIDNEGLEGIEKLFDDKLKGKPGWRHLVRDARRQTILYNEKESIPPQNGYSLVLTIDSVIQYIAEEELEKMCRKFNASEASVIVMEPRTGRILAMANYPDYDLNMPGCAAREVFKNDSVASVYEPGSVFKIITASAALNEGVVALNDEIYCEKGEYKVGGRVLHDFHPYGELSFRDIIALSSNIGTVKVAEELGKEKVYEYIRKFGFGEKTGIDMPGEVAGISRPPRVWSRSDITTIPIGQGIAVTPIQLVTAMNVIANGGYLMKPYAVEKILSWEGKEIKCFTPVARWRVIDETTCDKLKEALHRVVTDGTAKRVNSRRYKMCGKTGTAQMVNPQGGYYTNKYYATFVGFAPMEEPLITVVVSAKDPHPVHFGGSVAGPAFKNIAERVLQYIESNKGTPDKSAIDYNTVRR